MFKVYSCSVWPLCLSNINQYIWERERADMSRRPTRERGATFRCSLWLLEMHMCIDLYGKPGGLSKEQVQVSCDDYWWLSYTFVWMFLTKSGEVTSLCRIHSSKCHDMWKPFWLTIPCLSRPVAKTFEPKGQRHSGCPIAAATRDQKY